MKLSIDGYSYHGLLNDGMMDIFHYLETVKYRHGVDAVGIWNGFFPGQRAPHLAHVDGNEPELGATGSRLDPMFVSKLKSAVKTRGMKIPNIAADWCSVWDDDPSVREENYQNALVHIRAAADLGAQSLRIDWGVRRTDLTSEEFAFIAERYREYSTIASETGMLVGPENHFGASLQVEFQIKMADAVNSPFYGILLHMGHWEGKHADEGDTLAAPYAMHTHVSQAIADNKLEERLIPLIKADYSGYWGIEHHSAKNEYVMVEWQLARVKRALTSLGIE